MKKIRLSIMALSLVLAMLLPGCGGSTSEQEIVDPSPAPVVEGTESAAPTEDKTEQATEAEPGVEPETEKEPESETETAAPEGEPEKEPETAPEAQPEQGAETTDTPAAEPEKEPEQPVHEHQYDNTVIPPTCEAGGYTLHQCACGEQYKDAETKATGHTYQASVTAPTCTKGGYTTYTCACGDTYKGDETAATGHKYGQKIIAPTTQAEGYTLNTCEVCGDSYKSDIVEKLPEASAKPEETTRPEDTQKPTETTKPEDSKQEDVKPTEPVKPEETQKPEDNKSDDEWENTNGEGDSHIEAGVFATGNSKTAPVYSGSNDIQDVLGDINGYVGNVYDYRFYATGIGKNDNSQLGTAMISQNSDGKFGITVYGWRHSYDSGTAENKVLNVVLEAMRYFAGGKSNVAYSLWSFCDYKNINGSANSDNFGFHDVEKTSIGWIIEMDGVKILLDNTVSGQTTYWFI